MQSATTDVNAACLAIIGDLRFGRKIGDEKLVRRCIMDINGLMPPELKIEFIQTNDFDVLLNPTISVQCPKCKLEVDVNKDTIQEVGFTWDEHTCKILDMKKHDVYVECIGCGICLYYETDKSLSVYSSHIQTFDLKTMPTPPLTDTFLGQSFQRAKFWKWADIVIPVLFDKIREFRNMFAVDDEEEQGGYEE